MKLLTDYNPTKTFQNLTKNVKSTLDCSNELLLSFCISSHLSHQNARFDFYEERTRRQYWGFHILKLNTTSHLNDEYRPQTAIKASMIWKN